jgi:uncharacterized protein (TIGR00730 family)
MVKEIIYPIFLGKIVQGLKIGRTLGFPTINLESTDAAVPQDGVYIVQTTIDNVLYCGIMSIGNRPTFEGKAKTIEVHLLDFSGDCPQNTLTVKPFLYVRENVKFENTDLLKQQLQKDKAFASQYAKNHFLPNNNRANMKSIAVFCGSRMGENPAYKENAYQLGKLFAEENITLVYGGGGIGLMGVVADAVLEHQGKVIGVIPHFFNEKEVGHEKISETIWVESLSERKTKIAEISDGFITLPGGFGTLDELFEVLVYSQLNLHKKPVGLLNINDFYTPMLFQLWKMKQDGFLYDIHYNMLLEKQSPKELLDEMRQFSYVQDEEWIRAIKK